MLYKTAKKLLTSSFKSSKKLANMASNGFELDLSKKAMTEMETHMAESAKKMIEEGKLSKTAINNGVLKLTGKEALMAKYSNNTTYVNGANELIGDMAKISAVAAAGVIGLRTTQKATSLVSGDW